MEYFKYLTRYEIARIVGARALQIAMGAPILIDISEEKLKEIRYDPIDIAIMELKEGKIPLVVLRKNGVKKYPSKENLQF